jgi:hypothetical protein
MTVLATRRRNRGKTLVWSKGRNLASFGGNTYAYKSDGIRIRKTVGGIQTNFFFDLDGKRILRERTGLDNIDYRYGLDGLIGFRYKGLNYYYRKNVQQFRKFNKKSKKCLKIF